MQRNNHALFFSTPVKILGYAAQVCFFFFLAEALQAWAIAEKGVQSRRTLDSSQRACCSFKDQKETKVSPTTDYLSWTLCSGGSTYIVGGASTPGSTMVEGRGQCRGEQQRQAPPPVSVSLQSVCRPWEHGGEAALGSRDLCT